MLGNKATIQGPSEQVIAEKSATRTPKPDKQVPDVEVKRAQRVALMPVRYALGNDYMMNGLPNKSPKIGGNFKHDALPGKTNTHITLRTLRSGYLYIYSEKDKSWSLFETIAAPREKLKEVQGKGWKARQFTREGLLFINDDERLWLAYSDSRWTTAIMKKAQDDSNFRNNHMRLFDPKQAGKQPHACALAANWKKDGTEKSGPTKEDASKFVADINKETLPNAFWYSRHAFDKKPWFNTRSYIEPVAEEFLHGAVIALDDPTGIAMDLGTLMHARLDQFLMRPAKGFSDPKISYKWAMTTGSAIGAIQGIVCEQAVNKKRLLKKGFAVLEGISASLVTRSPHQALLAYQDYKNVNSYIAANMGTITSEAWKKYNSKYDAQKHQEWMDKTLKEDMSAFDQEWILPLAEAYVSFVKGHKFKNHFKHTYDPSDVHNGVEFAKTVAQCYLGVQDKVHCKEHMQEELDASSIEESLLVRALLLNHQEIWKDLQTAREQGTLSSKPKDEKAKEKRKALVFSFASKVHDKLVGKMMDPKSQENKIWAPIIAVLGSPLQDLMRKKGEAVPVGFEAAAIASGKVIQHANVSGTIGEKIHANKVISTKLAAPGLSESKVLDAAAVDVELARRAGVNLSEAAKDTTIPLLKEPDAPLVGSLKPTEAVEELEKLKGVKGATSRFYGLAGVLGSLLTITALFNLTETVDKAVGAKPDMRVRAWTQLGASIGGAAEGISQALLKISMAGWFGDLSATYTYAFLKNAGAGLGVAAGLTVAVMDIISGRKEWKKGNRGLAFCYWTSAAIGFAGATVSALIALGFISAATPIVGWIILAIALLCIVVNALISVLKDNSLQEWLGKCCWGKGELFNSFDEECKELKLALAEA